jgi:hypothetical protein
MSAIHGVARHGRQSGHLTLVALPLRNRRWIFQKEDAFMKAGFEYLKVNDEKSHSGRRRLFGGIIRGRKAGNSEDPGISAMRQRRKQDKRDQGIRRRPIDEPLPAIIDDTAEYLPEGIQADLVLDFLRHPDLSHDLAVLCGKQGIALVASGKKWRIKGTSTPPT